MSPVIRAVGLFHLASRRTPTRSAVALSSVPVLFPSPSVRDPLRVASSFPSFHFVTMIFVASVKPPTIPDDASESGTWIPSLIRKDTTFTRKFGSRSSTLLSAIVFLNASIFLGSDIAVLNSSVFHSNTATRPMRAHFPRSASEISAIILD